MSKRFKEIEHDSSLQNNVETRPQSVNRDRSDSTGSADIVHKSMSKTIDNDDEKYALHLDTEVSSSVYYNYVSARGKLPSSGSTLKNRFSDMDSSR